MSNASSMVKELLTNLPEHFKEVHGQLFNDLQPQLESWLSSLNLVTQSEFDAQTKVLHRAQKALTLLEEKVQQLEQIILNEPSNA